MQKTGVPVPAGMSPYKVIGNACGTRSADCQKIVAAVNADTAAPVRADGSGKGSFSAVVAGTYYLMISAQLKVGSNTITLDQANALVVK
jgi:hypothetical protein